MLATKRRRDSGEQMVGLNLCSEHAKRPVQFGLVVVQGLDGERRIRR